APRLPVPHENVPLVVGVAGYQVAGDGLEGDEATIRTDRGSSHHVTVAALRLITRTGDIDLLRASGLTIPHEHVPLSVGVAGYQVASTREEGNEASVRADRRNITAV